MPTEMITSLAWGGKNLDILFVTSATEPYDLFTGEITDRKLTPDAGRVFMVKGLGVKGLPMKKLIV